MDELLLLNFLARRDLDVHVRIRLRMTWCHNELQAAYSSLSIPCPQ